LTALSEKYRRGLFYEGPKEVWSKGHPSNLAKEKGKMVKLGFIGAGTVGTALAIKLSGRGYPIVAVSSRSLASARNLAKAIDGCSPASNNQDVADAAELVFITTPDDAIAPVASQVKWHQGQSAVHCSGANSAEILGPAKRLEAHVGVLHPLQTFASPEQAIETMPGSTFSLEAKEPLLKILKGMIAALECNWIELKAEDKVIYHASSVIAANYLVALVNSGADLWQTFGIPREQAAKALLPLIKGVINGIETVGIPGCLTGPISRGDVGTIKKHLEALEKVAPSLLATYKELGVKTIPIALAKGKINQKQAEELEALLKQSS
jgi:predicted short-subunit dehydrogenase-like oxidoreductase (DUF2520 family)